MTTPKRSWGHLELAVKIALILASLYFWAQLDYIGLAQNGALLLRFCLPLVCK